MAAPSENGEAAAAATTIDPQHPGVFSRLSNTFQSIKMPWSKDDQGGAPQGNSEVSPLPESSAVANANDAQAGGNVFSATMSKVSSTISNIQMPWSSKDQPQNASGAAPGAAAIGDFQTGAANNSTNSENVITGAFSKVSNTISGIQMPWSNKNEAPKVDGTTEAPADAAAAAGEGNMLTNTFSKVTNTISNIQMPWTNKAGEQGATVQANSSPDAVASANSLANGANNDANALNKVTGFFSSVFKPGSSSTPAEPNAATNSVPNTNANVTATADMNVESSQSE